MTGQTRGLQSDLVASEIIPASATTGDTCRMQVNDGWAGSGRFVAYTRGGFKWSYLFAFQLAWVIWMAPSVVYAMTARFTDGAIQAIGVSQLTFVILAIVAGFWFFNRKKIRICVMSDGLTINKRPGAVFSFHDARLGPLGSGMGTALHLRCGPDSFVVIGGGGGPRTPIETRSEAPPTLSYDAVMHASAFDELVAVIGRQAGWR